MKPVFQTKHGLGGNCLAACLASILEVPIDTIPDLAPEEARVDFSVQPRLRQQYLATKGLAYLEIDLAKQAFHWVEGAIPRTPVLFAVRSPSWKWRMMGYGHFVVGEIRQGETCAEYHVLHDPIENVKPYEKEITAIGFLVPLFPHRVSP